MYLNFKQYKTLNNEALSDKVANCCKVFHIKA